MSEPRKRFRDNRMMVDIPEDVQLAVRLRSLKEGIAIGKVVEDALREVYDDDIEEAKVVISNRKKKDTNSQEAGESE